VYVAGVFGVGSVVTLIPAVRADFATPITANPSSTYTASIGVNYNQVQTFTEPLLYDSNFDPEPDVYWFKYVSDGKTAVTFDTLGTNITTGGGGFFLPSTNETQIAVYTSTGTPVAISKNVVDSTGNPIEIAKFLNEPEPPPTTHPLPTDYYYAEDLSKVTFAPNAPSDPKWDVNPNDPTGFTGWVAPDNAAIGSTGQEYYPPDWPTTLNEYHVWSTALSKYDLTNKGSIVLSNGSSGYAVTQSGWRTSDYDNAGPASTWNQYNALPAGTYYIAVASAAVVFSGDTYTEQYLEAPIHYDENGDEPNNGSLPILTQPLGTWQYYDDPTSNSFYGTIELNVTETPATVQYEWNIDANGNWSTPANWAGPVPQNAGDTASFLATNTAPRTITLDAPETVGHLVFNSAYQYTIAGSQTLTLNNNGSNGDVIVYTGSHIIAAPLAVVSSSTIITYPSTALSINGGLSIAAGQTLTKLGTGALSIGGVQTNGTGSAIYVGEGTASISSDPGSNVALTSAASVNFPASTSAGIRAIHLASLSITEQGLVNGTVTLAGPGISSESNRTVLVTSAVNFTGTSSLGWTGQLDLGGNDLIVHGGILSQLLSQIISGYNSASGSLWSGSGIVSSQAQADSTHLTTLGILPNSAGGYSSFDGQPVSSSDVLIKYTYYGDANLDGQVNSADYTRIDSGFLSHATGWWNGDFNYDGVVNGSDYTLIDNAFNTQGASITAVIANPTTELVSTSVPEPSSAIGTILLTSASLARRRRRPYREISLASPTSQTLA
jgi:hypothetical protein